MASGEYFGLVTTSSGADFYFQGNTLDEVREFLNRDLSRNSAYVGIINLSTLELADVGERYFNNEHVARNLIIETYNQAKKK